MSLAAPPSSLVQPVEPAAPPEKTLRRLFLTLFLRGRSSRGLKKQTAPKSIGQKLSLTLGFYALFGLFALFFWGQPIFALSVYLHAMTFVFLGMFVASSAGEILFNSEEADILLHRPVTPKALLWAKVRVLVEVSLWLAGAFNLAGFVVGAASPDGGWRFLIAHALSIVLEAMFCTGCVVMVYQLCLRWFGRERLDGLMTTAQVMVSIAAVLAGQLLPRLVFAAKSVVTFSQTTWWIALLPPAWFAGLDDALAGRAAKGSWILAALAILVTGIVLWAAFGKLARDYGTGLQRLGETVSRRTSRGERRRWIDRLVESPPLCWWLRDPVKRAAFLLTAAYLVRDRDVKLRVYPGLAPFLVLPVVILLPQYGRSGSDGGFGVLFVAAYLGIIPLIALSILQYSQHWQASDIFRAAPLAGPAPLCDGARGAVLCFLALPAAIGFGLVLWLPHRDSTELLLLLPGVIALPVYASIPALGGGGVPFSLPSEAAKSAGRGLHMMGALFSSFAIGGLALLSKSQGYFWWFIIIEAVVSATVYLLIRRSASSAAWTSLE
jgi:hypothetical protein